jgi:hypothetical protein
MQIALGIPSIVIWAVGIPVFLLYRLIQHKDTLMYVPALDRLQRENIIAKANLQRSLGFLAAGFRPGAYFWSIVLLCQKLFLVLISVFLVGQVQLQVACALLITFAFICLHLTYQPMNDDVLNMVELAALGTTFVLFALGSFFFIPDCISSEGDMCVQSISVLIAFVFFLFLCICAFGLFIQVSRYCKQQQAEVAKVRRAELDSEIVLQASSSISFAHFGKFSDSSAAELAHESVAMEFSDAGEVEMMNTTS